MNVPPKKETDYPSYMYDDGDRGGWLVINPVTKKKKRYSDEQKARQIAEGLKVWVQAERERAMMDAGRPTIAGLVDLWLEDRLPFMPWTGRSRRDRIAQLKRVKKL